jgi:hypothetical protein
MLVGYDKNVLEKPAVSTVRIKERVKREDKYVI